MPLREKGRACDDARDYQPALAWAHVTVREAEVARLVAFGYSNAEAAEELDVCVSTVKAHVARLLLKLGVRTRGVLIGVVNTAVRELREERSRKQSASVPALRNARKRASPKPAPRVHGGEQRERGQA